MVPDVGSETGLSVEALMLQAVDALQNDDSGRAEQALQCVLKDQPHHADAIHFLGVLRHQQGRMDEALALLMQAIEAAPGSPGMRVNLGNVLYESGLALEAITAYQAAVGLDPGSGQPWCNLGTVFMALGRAPEACQAWEQATALAPANAEAWYGLSRARIELGQIHQGLMANSRAISLWPRNLLAREQVLRALVMLGENDEAAKLYREWLAQEPDNPVALHQMAAIDPLAHDTPARASDAYIETVFNSFAPQFEAKLQGLAYRAPELVANALLAHLGNVLAALDIADLGCGTGLCGPGLRPMARHLVGCDLSTGMLMQARRRSLYDALYKVELVSFLSQEPRSFDVVACADTLCYFGALDGVASAAASALREDGCFVFTVEALEPEFSDYRLQPTGRYAHSREHIERVLQAAGFAATHCAPDVLRQEAGQPVAGWVVTAAMSARGSPQASRADR